MYPLIKTLTTRPAYTALAVALLLCTALFTAERYQTQARRAAETKLAHSQNELHSTQVELAAAEERAAAYFAANQELVRRLADAQQQADDRREALEKARAANPKWANQALPDAVRKAVK